MTPRNTYAIGLQPCESMVCKFPPTQSENVGLGERNQCLLELRPLDYLQRICGTNGYSDPGATIRPLFRPKSMRYRTIKTTYLDPPDVASEFIFLTQLRSDAHIHSALRWRDSIPRRALMEFALLALITLAALGVAGVIIRV
jgi:hypothetical protein